MTHVDKILTRIFNAAKLIGLDDRLLHILPTFKAVWESDIIVRMDEGHKRSFRVMRAWHRSPFTDCPYKGGMRYHPDISIDMMKSHAIEMSLKCWIVGIPFGGAKGGIVINPNDHSPQELKNVTEALVKEMTERNLLGPFLDVLAPDIGTNPQIMSWIRQAYAYHRRVSENSSLAGVVTGKPVDKDFHFGGLRGRLPATGYGLAKALQSFFELKNLDKASLNRVAISGFGNVGRYVADFLSDAGFKIVALSDVDGGVYCANGIDNATRKSIGKPRDIEHGDKITNEEILELDVDILVPAAVENVITENNADKIKAKVILEGANGPTTFEADAILDERGVFVIPDILANAGGVSVSFFEWARNTGVNDERLPVAHGAYLSENEVLGALAITMQESVKKVFDCSQNYNISLRSAAYAVGLKSIEPYLIGKYYV